MSQVVKKTPVSNPQRDQNRQARQAAKAKAVEAFQSKYLEIVAKDLTADFTEEARLVEAVTESVAAYQNAYRAARATETVVSESVAA